MADEGKKVSFGFSKSIKKSALKIVPQPEEKKVDYIECLDAKAIKVVGGEEKKNDVLVIPMLGSKTWHDRIINKTDADIFEPKAKTENGVSTKLTNGNAVKNENSGEAMDVDKIKKEVPDATEEASKTLEEQAADEIIEDLKTKDIKVEDLNLAVQMTESSSLLGTQQSTLEDYEEIPIDVFGLAMLRGMGWKPGQGLGKDEKPCTASIPELRPRRMGLGADKAMQKINAQPRTKEEEDLKLDKGTFVKIITGKHVNNYGQIEGFDEGAGRLIVKMALSGESLSLDECLVQPVTKADYAKNSKVLNATKFEEYKNKKRDNGTAETSESEESGDDRESKNRRADRHHKSSSSRKKSKKRSKYSSDESNESPHSSTKRREENSSDSDYDYKHKRSKKTKKSHKRDSSAERSSKKSKRKDKDRERTRDKKSEYSESLDRRKHKKHKRSRSRTPQRR